MMEPIEVNIEKDKINDFKYIQDKVLVVCLQTLYELSKNSNKDFDHLAKRFLPVDNSQKEEIIKKFLTTIKTDNTEEISGTDSSITKTVPPIKKKRKIKRKTKVKNKIEAI